MRLMPLSLRCATYLKSDLFVHIFLPLAAAALHAKSIGQQHLNVANPRQKGANEAAKHCRQQLGWMPEKQRQQQVKVKIT